MKRGNNNLSFIGRAGATFTATTNQSLSLGVNDVERDGGQNQYSHNSGSFRARVTITRADQTLNFNVPGTAVAGNERFVANLDPGDHVIIDNISGTVNYNSDGPCIASSYTVGANGHARSQMDPTGCHDEDLLQCNAEPLPNDPHAGLLMKRGNRRTFIGGAWADAGTAAHTGSGRRTQRHLVSRHDHAAYAARARRQHQRELPGRRVLDWRVSLPR